MGATGSPDENVVALGIRLVEELDTQDTLAAWIAHHIAELISTYNELPPGAKRDAAGQECADEILRLWAHRAGLPSKTAIRESSEAVVRALERLDPSSDRGFYGLRHVDLSQGTPEVAALLRVALGIEARTQSVVRALIAEALERARAEDHEWIRLAAGHSLEDTEIDSLLENFLSMADEIRGNDSARSHIEVAASNAVQLVKGLEAVAAAAYATTDGLGQNTQDANGCED